MNTVGRLRRTALYHNSQSQCAARGLLNRALTSINKQINASRNVTAAEWWSIHTSDFSRFFFCVWMKLQEGQLVVCQFQFLRWSAYRDVPDSKKAFLNLLAQVHKWQRDCGEGRTVVHCLWVSRHIKYIKATMILSSAVKNIIKSILTLSFFFIKMLKNSERAELLRLLRKLDRASEKRRISC